MIAFGAVVFTALLSLSFFGNATAVSTGQSEYFTTESGLITVLNVADNAHRLTIYNLESPDTRYCQTDINEINEIGNFKLTCEGAATDVPPGTYSIIELDASDLPCNFLSYEQCKALPEFLGEAIFLVKPAPPLIATSEQGAGVGSITAYRPAVVIASPTHGSEFSNYVSVSYEATDQNDIAEKQILGLSSNPVSIYYSETSDTRRRVLIEKGLPSKGTYVWDARSVPEGDTFRIIVEATDVSNEVGEAVSEEFSLDHIVPVFSVSADPAITTGSPVAIRVESSRPLVSAPEVMVTQNGFRGITVPLVGSSTEFTGTYTVVPGYDGTARVTVKGTDIFGNVSTTTVRGGRFSVGVRPPQSPVLIYPEGSTFAPTSTTISIIVKVRPDTQAQLALNGTTLQTQFPDEEGVAVFSKVTINPEFNGGKNVVSVSARDLAGNASEATNLAVVFNSAPEARIVSPVQGDVFGTTTRIVLAANDRNKDKLSISYEASADAGASWFTIAENSTSKIFVWDTSSVTDGEYKVRAIVSDGTFKTVAVSPVFAIRNFGPRVVLSQGSQSAVSASSFSFDGVASVPFGATATGIVGVEYRTLGGEWRAVEASDGAFEGREERFTVELENLKDGTQTVEIRAKDTTGVFGSTFKTIAVDFGPPEKPTITKPVSGTVVHGTADEDPKKTGIQITVSGVAEAGSLVQYRSGSLSGAGRASSAGLFSIAGVTLADHGTNTLAFFATDGAGNAGAPASVSYFYNNPPRVRILSPRSGRGLGIDSKIQFSIVDLDRDPIVESRVFIAHPKSTSFAVIADNPKGNEVVWNTESLSDGAGYRVKVEASDGVDTTSEVSSFYVDKVRPTLALDPLSSANFGSEFTLAFSGTAEDTLSGIEYVEYSIDGKQWSKAVITKGYLTKQAVFKSSHPYTLPDGAYTLRVRSVDGAGNSSVVATRAFSVDTTAPRFGSFLLQYGSHALVSDGEDFEVPKGTALRFVGSLEADAESATLEWGDRSYPLEKDLQTGLWGADILAEDLGIYDIKVTAKDFRGNMGETFQIGVLKIVESPRVLRVSGSDGSELKGLSSARVSVQEWDAEDQRFVVWSGTSFGLEGSVVSGASGDFKLFLPRGRYRLVAEHEDYGRTLTRELILNTPQFVSLDIMVSEGNQGGVRNFIGSLFGN